MLHYKTVVWDLRGDFRHRVELADVVVNLHFIAVFDSFYLCDIAIDGDIRHPSLEALEDTACFIVGVDRPSRVRCHHYKRIFFV